MNMKKKRIITILSVVVLVAGIVGGTIAWLTAETDPLVNVFSTSGIQITLEESKEDYFMIPGHDIHKDPVASVVAGSEECWLFVKLEKSDNFDNYLTYEIADEWTQLTDKDGKPITDLIYCRKVLASKINSTDGAAYHVLKDDKVSVLDTVTDEMMTAAETNQPTLTITAYASQLNSGSRDFEDYEAWANLTKS